MEALEPQEMRRMREMIRIKALEAFIADDTLMYQNKWEEEVMVLIGIGRIFFVSIRIYEING